MDEAEFEVSWHEDDSRLIEFAEGMALVPEATVTAWERGVGDMTIHVVYDPFLGRLAVDSVEVSAAPGYEVTGTNLRAVRVQEYLIAAAENMVYRRDAEGQWVSFVASLEGGAWPPEITSDRELHAARVYELARLASMPPLKTVGEVLGVSQSTATRIIAQAKRSGKLRIQGNFGLDQIDDHRLVEERWRVDHELPQEVVDSEFARMFGMEEVSDGIR